MDTDQQGVGTTPPGGGLPRLARRTEGRFLAGVCSGLGASTSIDPVVYRVGFGVLTLAHGQGILLYILAVLFMPDRAAGTSVAERLFRRRFDAAGVLAIIGLMLCASVALSVIGSGVSTDAMAVLTVFGLVLLVAHARGVNLVGVARTLPERLAGHPPETPAASDFRAAPPKGAPLPDGMVDLSTLGSPGAARGGTSAPGRPAPDADDVPPGYGADAPHGYGPHAPSGYGPHGPSGYGPDAVDLGTYGEWDRPSPAARRRDRRKSPLTWLTICLAALAGGVAAAAELSGSTDWDGWTAVLATALAVVGGGLLLGVRFRVRGLATVGTLLTFALLTTSVAATAPRGGEYGDTMWRPTDAAQAARDYRVTIGNGTLDLTGLSVRPGEQLEVSAAVWTGQLKVDLPANARVKLDARVKIGDIRMERRTVNGPNARLNEVIEPTSGGSNPAVITLRIRGTLGDVELNR
ncbi:PspC domain-containing protein [Actinomadura rupiterrae]|uniref:PspC domain-containing protein n=1 Tax=Actinomadura rupiterrae TaxID=559627 RepID=UPI0020A54125|nr:PspC domain-containing protein [Actinomadura rupiterrae]MCP2335529.1 phage shock protein PspC (stress-responsive transcriptional regulator) [Actinomadura rupiterrae]